MTQCLFLLGTLVLCFAVDLNSVSSFAQQTQKSETLVGGGIYFDEVWRADRSPFVLTKNVKIGPNTTVTVEPGVVIEGDGHDLAVVGTFLVAGKGLAGDPKSTDTIVRIRNLHLVAGKGESGGIDLSSVEYTGGSILTTGKHKGNKVWFNIRESVVNNVPDIFLFFPTKDCAIERNVFVSSGGISAGTQGVEASIKNNVFYMQTSDYAVKNWFKQPLIIEYPNSNRRPDVYPKDMVVKHNSFLCTDRVAIRMDPRYNDAQLRIAQENYFGTSDNEIIEAMVFDKDDDIYVSERVKYKPVLDAPHPDTPTQPRVNPQWCAAAGKL